LAYIGVQPADAYTSFAVQHFTTSATTSYTLDHSVANENEIALFINNVRQEPGSSYAYTASGTTLTLSAATTTSDTMYCVFIGKAVQTVTPTLPIANFSSTGIDDNASSTSLTINSSGNLGVGTASPTGFTNYKSIVTDATSGGLFEIMIGGTRTFNMQCASSQANIQTRTNIPIIFDINTTEKMRISSDGLHLGGTGSANALDDYEEGTWTPVFTSSGGNYTITYSGQQGKYTKIGNTVVCHFLCAASGTPSGGSGTFRLGGLPFLPVTGAVIPAGHGSVGISNNLNINVDAVQLLWNLGTEATYADFMFLTDSSSVTSTANSPYTIIHNSNPRIDGTLVYRTNA
jgi:hypothetical protein